MKKITLRSEFDAIMSNGVRVSTEHFALHHLNTLGYSRIGAVVPKRWAKKAVSRNLVKRQIYVIARESEKALNSFDVVVRLKKPFQKTIYISASSIAMKRAVRKELQQLFNKVIKEP